MSSEEKGEIVYEVTEIHDDKSGEGDPEDDDMDELANIRREMEMLKENPNSNPRKIQIPINTRIVREDELEDVVLTTAEGEEGDQLLQIDSVAMEAAAHELVEEIIQDEEDELEEIAAGSVLHMQDMDENTQMRRPQLKYKVVNEETYQEIQEQAREKIDKNDPRSRLHFVKYLKREGKTVKIWECGICSKEFRHQYTLMRHLPTHTDERNFKCDTCGKAFRQMSTLSQHRAIHSDARPYVCEVCKKTFNRVSTLISHRKTHSEHKPHTCDLCGKGFHQKGNLRNHIFTHTNERPYKCEVCGKGFNQMSNLMCHKVKLCETEFPRRFALKSHQEYKHGIKFRVPERHALDPNVLRELLAKKKNKKEGKNLRIIHLPNGDRTLADVRNLSAIMQQQQAKPKPASSPPPDLDPNSNAGVIIDPIRTKAMKTARMQGQTPFALLKPAKGIPVLVKVLAAPHNKQMLVPATAEDLKSAGKVTVSPSVNQKEGENLKAVQIKVPVVATVIQRVLDDGTLVIEVEPPHGEQLQPPNEEDLEEQLMQEEAEAAAMMAAQQDDEEEEEDDDEVETEPHETQFIKTEVVDQSENDESMEAEDGEMDHRVTYVREDGSIISEEELAGLNPVNLLAAAVNLQQQQPGNQASQSLMELAGSGIQFVRPAGDGTYEILSQEEATQMMTEGGQAIEIVGDEQEIHEIVGEEGDDSSNMQALVEAIRCAGYQVSEGQKQIVISGTGEQVLMDEDQQEFLVGESGQIIVMGEDGQQVQYVLQEEEDENEDLDGGDKS